MDPKENITKTVEFDANSQPFGHEQPRFRKVVEGLFNEDVISHRLTDSQKELFELRFLKDKSFEEIASEVNKNVEEIEMLRNRCVENLAETFENCGVDLQDIFEEKDLVKKLEQGHGKILESFEKWIKQGIFTDEEVGIVKYYSRIFNGLGDHDSLVNFLYGNSFSDKNPLREGDNIKEIRRIVSKATKYFYAKHF